MNGNGMERDKRREDVIVIVTIDYDQLLPFQ
jgi:hypothetical protein